MSGTRSLSPRAPATRADRYSLVIAAHGDRGGLRSNRLAGTVAGMIADTGTFARVEVGLLRGEPALQAIGDALPAAGAVRVYPLFMSCGYYVNRAIPDCLGIGADGRDRHGRPVEVMEPIGLRPVMARIVSDRAAQVARQAGLKAGEAGILLAAHGSSKDAASREAARALARRMVAQGRFGNIECAFLEEPPFLGEALAGLAGPLVVIGLFIGEGMHGHDDLRAAVADAARKDVTLTPPLAGWGELAGAIRDDILAAAG